MSQNSRRSMKARSWEQAGERVLNRRDFVKRGAASLTATLLAAETLRAQPNSTVNMNGDFYIPVRPPAKADRTAQLDDAAVATLERTLACPCPCSLDIFTCRTTDVACTNSPAIHRDIVLMVNGGYSADEIVEQLTGAYGQRILLSLPKSGFNLVGWFLPFVAIGTGGFVLAALVRSWRHNALEAARVSAQPGSASIGVQATEEELARLNAALRDDSR